MELRLDETALRLLQVSEEKDTAIKELSTRLEGYYTCIRVLLERFIQSRVRSIIGC